MTDITITDLAAAGAMTGNEWVEIAQLSTTVTMTATTLSALASDNSYNDSAAQFIIEGFAVGDRVKVSGFTGNTANNIFVGKITALTAGKMTIGGTDGDVIVDDAAGESVTISKWVSRRTAYQPFRGALVKKAADQTGANYTTSTAIAWDSEEYDTSSIHDTVTNNSRLTVPSGVAYVRLSAAVRVNNVNVDMWSQLIITKNGGGAFVGIGQISTEVGVNTIYLTTTTAIVPVSAGDYFDVRLIVETDTSIDIVAAQSWFAMEIIG